MKNNNDSLAISFADSLSEKIGSTIGDAVEVGLDVVTHDGILKEIPLVSTVVAMFNIGKTIRDRHQILKLVSFIDKINGGILEESERVKYQKRFRENSGFHNQELEYIMIIIDQYVGFQKPKMIAELYLAYLREEINWNEFIKYAEAVSRFLPGDENVLLYENVENISPEDTSVDSVLRLLAMGLVAQNVGIDTVDHGDGNLELNNATGYEITVFGKKLRTILLKQ